ncbi:hypothetical protein Mapa_002526 [Marchantia paleacea]|nr:hypothetical protein Mapa_002526 [Marchantia paleacea]
MIRKMGITTAIVIVAALAAGILEVQASDPELTSDFMVPAVVDPMSLNGSFFTNSTLRNVVVASKDFATVTPVNDGIFPALKGLGVSSALLQFPKGSVNPPHTHPRGTEILFIIEGTLDVGLVDTANKLFTQTLRDGDLFVFPKGLVHFQINRKHWTVKALASFSSSNPGLVRLPNNMFKSNIGDDVLQKSFGVNQYVIQQLKDSIVN